MLSPSARQLQLLQTTGPACALRMLVLLVVLTLSGPAPACAAQTQLQTRPLPWSELEFAKNYLWLTASSHLFLKSLDSENAAVDWLNPPDHAAVYPDKKSGLWQLTLTASAASNHEEIVSWLDPQTLSAYQRSRFSEGRNKRFKRYRFLQDGIYRLRSEPDDGEENSQTQQWSQRSSRFLPYPNLQHYRNITTPEALLVLASTAALNSPGDRWLGYVYTDVDFFHVELRVSGEEDLAVDFRLTEQDKRCQLKSSRTALVIDILVAPTGRSEAVDDFELMSLNGGLQILLDPASRLPLQVRGKAPSIGITELDLVKAVTQGSTHECTQVNH